MGRPLNFSRFYGYVGPIRTCIVPTPYPLDCLGCVWFWHFLWRLSLSSLLFLLRWRWWFQGHWQVSMSTLPWYHVLDNKSKLHQYPSSSHQSLPRSLSRSLALLYSRSLNVLICPLCPLSKHPHMCPLSCFVSHWQWWECLSTICWNSPKHGTYVPSTPKTKWYG